MRALCIGLAGLLLVVAAVGGYFYLSRSDRTPPPAPGQIYAAKILVDKSERKMELLDAGGQVQRTYQIALGENPIGHKTQEGDGKTPEGIYTISGRNSTSRYHLSLRISYPNEQDKEQAKQRNVSPGGDIMIHGLPNGMGWTPGSKLIDWTDGCIAVFNEEIEEIWNMVPDGTTIEIHP